jgi:ribosomal-protein-alanine acetyltransferase
MDLEEMLPPTLPDLRIRVMRCQDLQVLTQIEVACFADPWSSSSLSSELVRPESEWLLALEPQPVGYVGFLVVAGEAELLRLAVEPSMRRCGVGRALLSAGLTRLARCGQTLCHLEVAALNHRAIALYESLGFTLAGRRQGYYRSGDDALLYRRKVA